MGKLAPRYVSPYRIIKKLPISWNYRCTVGVHDIFHVSQLKKCFRVPTEEAPLETFAVLKVGQNRDLTRSNAIKQ